MFELKQEFFQKKDGYEKVDLVVKAASLGELFTAYDRKLKSLSQEAPSYGLGSLGEDREARIKIKIRRKEGQEDLIKVLDGLAPIMEVLLDNSYGDDKYLYNRRKRPKELEIYPDYLVYDMGDSGEKDLVKASVGLIYSLVYQQELFQVLEEAFLLMRKEIVEGGFNSASFNGLQGYYFSRYFVKWLIDLRDLVEKKPLEGEDFLFGLEDYVDKLENPRDKSLKAYGKLAWEDFLSTKKIDY